MAAGGSGTGSRKETAVIALLMGLLADVVFQSASAAHRSFETEMARYMDQRGFAVAQAPASRR